MAPFYASFLPNFCCLSYFPYQDIIPKRVSLLTAARRIQENMSHKRHSLSDSIMNLIDGNKELLNHLNNCRKEATNSVASK